MLQRSILYADYEAGFFYVRLYVRHPKDLCKYTVRECRCWPEVRRTQGNTTSQLLLIKPQRVDRLIQRRPTKYYTNEIEINLINDLIIGPLNFAKAKEYNNRSFYIPSEAWVTLITKASKYNINVDNINSIITTQSK